jgi:uncharacterized protein YceH (UPF0502 family)
MSLPDAPSEWTPLNAAEARVLGCLIEKQATTPDLYPLTVNATQAAANQKTARDPVMALSPGDVNHALRQLEQRGIAKQTFSSRAERYEHRAGQAFDLTQPQVVLLGLLLLRGAQTVHELLARSERMAKFDGAEDVHHQLERLAQHRPALAQRIPRGPGQREDRYAHLLCGPLDAAVLAARASSTQGPVAVPALEARIEALEADVAALREAVAALELASSRRPG